jgi:2-phosphosulfolactate phosphatase
MTTTNGTRTLVAAARADLVLVGAFVNCRVTADAAGDAGRDVLLAAAGTEGHFAIEDVLCAGAMSERLAAQFDAKLDDSALCARLAWRQAQSSLPDAVLRGRGASNVRTLGLGADVDFALHLDSIALVAKVVLEPLRVITDSHLDGRQQES